MKHNKAYDYYKTQSIHSLKELLCQKSTECPECFAVKYVSDGEEKCISYRMLFAQVRQLGAYLIQRGFQKKHIAIWGANSYHWLLSFLAIVTSGNVAVAMDKDMPDEEAHELATEMDVASFLCAEAEQRRFLSTFSDLPIEGFAFPDMEQMLLDGQTEIDSGNRAYDEIQIGEQEDCCIFFTSGTTGKRKGVVLTHGNIAADIVRSCALFQPDGGTYAVLPFHHAFGLIVGVLMFWHYGQCVFVGSGLKRFRKEMLLAKPQTMMLVPVFVETMYKQIWDTAKRSKKDRRLRRALLVSGVLLRFGIDMRRTLFREIHDSFGGNLDFIICGGAPLDPEYVRAFRGFGIEILNGYGTTECSPCVSVNRNYHHKDGTVGMPLPDSRVRVAEDGEIMVSGPHVMREYYNDKEATREALTDGWYRTGDVGYIDEDGFLVLTGRKKNLIILSNGENISPELLEQQILRIQNVEEAVVTGDGDLLSVEIYAKDADEPVKKVIQEEISRLNKIQPAYLRIAKTVFRDTEFEKTTTRKIKR